MDVEVAALGHLAQEGPQQQRLTSDGLKVARGLLLGGDAHWRRWLLRLGLPGGKHRKRKEADSSQVHLPPFA
jgi:hypothetical protein